LMKRPGVFGFAIIESPAVWIGDGELIRQARAAAADAWPERIFIAVGDQEGGRRDVDHQRWINDVRALESILREAGLGDDRLRVVVEAGAVHNEAAWAGRLPGALAFLCPRED
ncbi:MAG: hypothetical protein KDA21_02295, partial [Phycisphaerales bacterium]|nr:hypothetical protein [Phycisphaerales bacterium]